MQRGIILRFCLKSQSRFFYGMLQATVSCHYFKRKFVLFIQNVEHSELKPSFKQIGIIARELQK